MIWVNVCGLSKIPLANRYKRAEFKGSGASPNWHTALNLFQAYYTDFE